MFLLNFELDNSFGKGRNIRGYEKEDASRIEVNIDNQ